MFFESMDGSWQGLVEPHRDMLDQIERQLSDTLDLTPPKHQVMRAFELPVEKVRVVLLGQDPYPASGMACGLAFANSPGTKTPPSLKNLMKELKSDIPRVSANEDIARWADQGVLLLNSALTTQVGVSGAHQDIWREFIEVALRELGQSKAGELAVISLGTQAKKLSEIIKIGTIVQAPHPSPLSAHRGFFGSRIYSRVNKVLGDQGQEPIDWSC
jgi:uracil-DNA glycosylase